MIPRGRGARKRSVPAMSAIISRMPSNLPANPVRSDLELAAAVVRGDSRAWSEFLMLHGGLILGAVTRTCEQGCRVSRSGYACVLHTLSTLAPEPSEAPSWCQEALPLFRWVVQNIRERLPQYTGTPALSAWLLDTLVELRGEYLGTLLGRISIPPALAQASVDAQTVFRLSARVGDRQESIVRSGLSPERFAAAENEISACFQAAHVPWWPWMVSQAAGTGDPPCQPVTQPVPTLPTWLLRSVLDTSEQEAPESQTGPRHWRARLLAQPDWLAGVVVGGVVCVFVLLIVLPRQEYARPVKAPDDQVLALAALPLNPELGKRLAQAREDLRKGKIESAIHNLNRVLAARPDEQEARWLLASTYDRLGDQSRAFKHYKVFLQVHDTRSALRDDRAQRARERLSLWDDD